MDTAITSQAWDIPHSNMVINITRMNQRIWQYKDFPQYYYIAGASIKGNNKDTVGFSLFNEKGEDRFTAFENLLQKVETAASLSFRVLEMCEDSKLDEIPVVDARGWDIFPPKEDNFAVTCFSSLSRFVYLVERTKEDITVSVCKRRGENGHSMSCGYVKVGNDIVFKSKPSFEKKEVVGNIRDAFTNALGMLHKLQRASWELMIDSDTPDYDMDYKEDDRRMVLKKRSKAE